MKRFTLILFALLLEGSGVVLSQGLTDALQFSRKEFHGSSRFNAMGGAFTAVGGDLAAIHLNPASAGVFTKSELGFTLGIGHTSVNAIYYGNAEKDQFGKANVNNMGVVFASEINHPDWKMLNVGITYARTNDYNRRISYSGTQSDHSFAQQLEGLANSGSFSQSDLQSVFPFDVYPAFEAFVIDTLVDSSVGYYSPIGPGEEVTQKMEFEESGRTSEFEISLGTNYKDRLYLGLGVKVGTLVLSRTFDHFETPENQEMIDSYRYGSELEIRGTSYAVSVGVIARLTNMFRIGISAETPQFYVNNEFFSNDFTANLSGAYADYAQSVTGLNGTQFSGASPEGNNRYNFNTPWRFTGGIAAVFGPRALLSAEYEYQDYGTARFRENSRSGINYNYDVENANIESVFGPTNNVRAGFEYRLLPFSLRAGYAYFQNPVKSRFRGDINRDMHQLSLGGGVRLKKVYLDAAYFYRMTDSQYALYDSGNNESALLSIQQHGFSFTIGVRY